MIKYFCNKSSPAKGIKWHFLLMTVLLLSGFVVGCNNIRQEHQHDAISAKKDEYVCPMHPDVKSDKAGKCSICGMDLVKKQAINPVKIETTLETLALPSNEYVVSNISVTAMERRSEQIEIRALGNINYDTRQAGTISSRVSGRIEKLYVRYRYQKSQRASIFLICMLLNY
jgi:Cu(I)/Ag(I) efflux system membrane fusion protein